MEEADRLLKSGRAEAAHAAYLALAAEDSAPAGLLERRSACLLQVRTPTSTAPSDRCQMRRPQEALSLALQAVATDPSSRRARLRAAQALLGLARAEEARAVCLQALEEDPAHQVTHPCSLWPLTRLAVSATPLQSRESPQRRAGARSDDIPDEPWS